MVSLEIEFAGLNFMNPFLLASGPPTRNADMLQRAFEQGWAGAVIKTIPSENLMQRGMTHEPRPVLVGFPTRGKKIGMGNISVTGQWRFNEWRKAIPDLKRIFPDRIILGSFGAEVIKKEWQDMAVRMEDTGVDGIELDLSCTHATLGKDAPLVVGEHPNLTAEVLSWVTQVVKVPVIPKLPATIHDWKAVLASCRQSGAKGVASINTLSCFMGLDLNSWHPLLDLNGYGTYSGYSGPGIKPIAMRVISQMFKAGEMPISGIGGVSNWEDVAEFILLGASTVQVCTAVMWEGYGIVQKMIQGLQSYLHARRMPALKTMVGAATPYIKDSVFQLKPDEKLTASIDETCTSCGRCVIACRDGAYQAITMQLPGKATVDPKKCMGCGLCLQVCPVRSIRLESVR